MNTIRKEIRNIITHMSRREACEWLASFQLREDEERAIMLCDVKGLSVVQASMSMCCSREVVSRLKAQGYDRMNRDLKLK